MRSVEALEQIGSAADGPLLVALDDRDQEIRQRAAVALERARSYENLEETFVSTVEALANGAADPLVADRLHVLMADPDPMVAAAACVALLRGPSRPGAVESLRRSLANDETDVRLVVVRRLRSANADDAVTFLRPMLEDPSSAVRTEALRTLASAAPAAVITPALGALEGQDAPMREVAIGILGDLDLHDHAAAIERLARARASRAHQDLLLAASIPPDGAGTELLRTAVLERGRTQAVVALAFGSDAIAAAIGNRGSASGARTTTASKSSKSDTRILGSRS